MATRLLPRLTPIRGAVVLGVGGVAAYVNTPKAEEKDFSGKRRRKMIQRFESMVERGQTRSR